VVDSWFREAMSGKFKEMLTDSDSIMFDYLRQDTIKDLIYEHEKGRSDNHKILFSLVAFEEWLRSIKRLTF
jgi:asparagine synthase (glutamine-hydrolysing)